ncbi:unnamed protein product [Cuscuta epithymum]|uniref:RING-type E3 ubiquitin transferase n=1 Tax=Cuscuta epithymum TaxID=186058 RepID=A0AAV0DLD3_9ASTE|nr:unnamed protein product [Cuscuta epithymum]
MGQRNTPYSSLVVDLEADQGGQIQSYGTLTSFPQPNVHSVLPVASNVYLHPLPDYNDNSPLFYGMTQHNRSVHPLPIPNLDLALASSSIHHNPYMPPTAATREFSIPFNHRTHDHSSFSNNPGMAGIQTATHGTIGSFKIKNAVGSSSSDAPLIARAHESNASLMDSSPLMLPADHGDSSLVVNDGSHISLRNMAFVNGPDSVAAHHSNHFAQGNHVSSMQLSNNPWSDMRFNRNSCELEPWSWNQAAVPFPYVHGRAVGPTIEAGNTGIQSYQVRGGNGSLTNFMHPPIPLEGHSNVHHLPQATQGMRCHNTNFPPLMAVSSSRHITHAPSSSNLNYLSGFVEMRPTYVGPLQPAGVRLYRSSRRNYSNYMPNHNLPNMRVMPEDGVAMLEIPGYYNGMGESGDQHRDMRMDIDHMSYEELLALGEHIGSVTTGLSEEMITRHLKTKPFSSSKALSVSKATECLDQNMDLCVICQNDYKDQENIGTVECGHAYHVHCIKKWLIVKNSCPICKLTALPMEPKDL